MQMEQCLERAKKYSELEKTAGNTTIRREIANALALKAFDTKVLEFEQATFALSFLEESDIDAKIKAAGQYALALTQAAAYPKWCYDTAIRAFELWDEVGSVFQSNYKYHKSSKQQYHDTCPICGSNQNHAHYCANQLLVIDKNSELMPVKLWLKCEGCGNLFSYNFPVFNMGEMNGHYTRLEEGLSITPQHSMSIYGTILNKCKSYGNGTKYLEIGIGNGEMLASALELGFDVEAVEICKEDCEKISAVLDIPIYWSDFLQVDLKKKYDVIVMGDVLEHVSQPMEALIKAKHLLEEDGVLWVSTPNYNSGFTRLMKFKDPMWNQKNHYTYFSYETLQPLLEQIGLQVLHYEISGRYRGSMELFIKHK